MRSMKFPRARDHLPCATNCCWLLFSNRIRAPLNDCRIITIACHLIMQNQDDSMECDKKLINLEYDLLSQADAIQCLNGQIQVTLPNPHINACNNLDEYFMKSTLSTQRAQRCNHSHSDSPGSSRSSNGRRKSEFQQPFAAPLVRNFDKILKKTDEGQVMRGSPQLLKIVKRKSKVDVFSKADRLDSSSGPLVLLRSKQDRVVRVLIRRRRKVPYISRVIEYKGTLVLFDKHMNLYLSDVIESFKYSKDEELMKRARHRNNILLRGDNIIWVS